MTTQDAALPEGRVAVPAMGRPNQLLSRSEIETEYCWPTRRWLELAAVKGDGPPMIRISRKQVRYQRAAFEAWLASREVHSTAQAVGGI